jgi:RNA polymerase sigma-70 factor (ECF subfamily)
MKGLTVNTHRDTDGSENSVERTALSLIQRVKLLDAQAWEQFVTLYGPLVYSWVRRAGIAPEDARDVVQDVFQSVVRYVAGFRRDRPGDTFRGWLHAIAKSKVAEHRRGRRGTSTLRITHDVVRS